MELYIFDAVVAWMKDHALSVILIVFLAYGLDYLGRKIIKSAIKRSVNGHHFGRAKQPSIDVKKRQDTIVGITALFWKSAVFLGAGLALFRLFFPKVDILPVFASAGLVGAVIGFGAQSMIKDLIAGVFIIAENQYRVGDVVEIDAGGIGSGTVEHITLRSTVLRDASGNVHYISNGNVVHVINKTMGYSKVNFALSVRPSTDVDKLAQIIENIGLELSKSDKWKHKIIEAPHFVNLGALSDVALEVNITGTTQPGEQWAATSEMKKRLLQEIKGRDDIKLAQYIDLSSLGRKK